MSKDLFFIPEDIREILSVLKQNGIRAFPVGGCVRDHVLNKTPSDYDISAEAVPKELIAALDKYSLSCEGIEYGTVCVHTGNSDVEITCCRSEQGYSDCRRPDKVEFTRSITEDLRRRDFTVNAMAYDVDSGEIIDPFAGRNDAERGILRCVGDPQVRFGEDSLRILRALRFASTLGFSLDDECERQVRIMHPLLSDISGERILCEMKKLLCGDNVFRVLTDHSDAICTVVPEMKRAVGFDQNNPHHIYTVYEHIARTVAALPPDPYLRLAMFFHDMAKPYVCTVDSKGIYHFRGHPDAGAEMADKVLRRLHADRATLDEVRFLIKYHDVRPEPSREGIHKYLCMTGFEGAKKLLYIRRADLSAQSPDYQPDGYKYIDRCEELIKELEAEGAPVRIADLDICGNDITAMGVEEGPEIGKMLEALLSEVASQRIPNEKSSLIAECKHILAQNSTLYDIL